jgi:hypothetical protein
MCGELGVAPLDREVAQMSIPIFAIRVEADLLLAAEIDDQVAATVLDSGQPILLGTAEELADVARRLGRSLVTVAARRNLSPLRESRSRPLPANRAAHFPSALTPGHCTASAPTAVEAPTSHAIARVAAL